MPAKMTPTSSIPPPRSPSSRPRPPRAPRTSRAATPPHPSPSSPAPWKFTGRAWTAIRIFAADGTFTSADHANESGNWKIEGNKINLIYKDGHIDTLDLPLDPKLGTDAADQHGGPVLAIQIDPSSIPKPADTTAQNGGPDSTPGAAHIPRPAQGHTPPPFGTALPGGE